MMREQERKPTQIRYAFDLWLFWLSLTFSTALLISSLAFPTALLINSATWLHLVGATLCAGLAGSVATRVQDNAFQDWIWGSIGSTICAGFVLGHTLLLAIGDPLILFLASGIGLVVSYGLAWSIAGRDLVTETPRTKLV